MAEARVPTSVVVSLGVHAGALMLFGLMMREAPKQAAKVVEGVDLLIQAPKPRAARAATPKPPPLSTFDFLKLAIPSAPRAAAPAALDVPVPQRKIALAEAPKLQDSKLKALPKLDALNLKERPIEAKGLDVKVQTRRQAADTLAAMPRLEDVGRRRVKNLDQALALEEGRREAVAAVGLPAVSAAPSRRQAVAAVAALKEAAPESGGAPLKGLSFLPERAALTEARPAVAAAAPKLAATVAPRLERRQAGQADAPGPKKGIEIEGPLADRRVVSSVVPKFPEWVKAQGVLEMAVAIRFTVDEEGNVMPGMKVASSSGDGRTDRMTMDSLKNWKFAPKPGAGVQWGVITFRFVLE